MFTQKLIHFWDDLNWPISLVFSELLLCCLCLWNFKNSSNHKIEIFSKIIFHTTLLNQISNCFTNPITTHCKHTNNPEITMCNTHTCISTKICGAFLSFEFNNYLFHDPILNSLSHYYYLYYSVCVCVCRKYQ